MRLLFLVSSLPIRKIGGTEIVTLRVCEELAKRQHHEPFIYTIPQSEQERDEKVLSQAFGRYKVSNFPGSGVRFSRRVNSDRPLSYTRSNLDFARGLKAVVQELSPEVVVAMKVQPPGLFCGYLPRVLEKEGLPYLFMVRGFTDLLDAGREEGYAGELSLPERLRNRLFYRRLLPRYVRASAGVVVQTSSQLDHVRETYGLEPHLLFNPVAVESIRDSLANDVGSGRGKTPAPEGGSFRLVYVGSMIPRKNLETLLRALRFLVQRNGGIAGRARDLAENMMLYLVGGGKGSGMVRNQVQELGLENHVTFTGEMAPGELWRFLATCHVFVFPSFSEGFPNAMLEAMACSLPVISSDFAGVHDLMPSERNGLIFRKEDFRDLAEKIIYCYENEEYRNEVSRHNRQFVKEFSWERFMEKFEGILQELK